MINRCSFDDLFIFEMANNHQGSVQHGLRIIEAMAAIARDVDVRAAVKLQYRELDTFIHPDYRDRTDLPHIPRFLSTRLSRDQFRELVNATRSAGLLTMVTPFDEASVDDAVNDDVDIIKVASCSASDWPLLEAVASTGKPVIASTGGQNIAGIDRVANFFSHKGTHFALLHCIGQYPAPSASLCMRFLSRMQQRYPGVPIGYSGHESPENTDVINIAIALGARLFERHVGVPTDTISLNAYSSTPRQVKAWIEAALAAGEICGSGHEKKIGDAEIASLRSLARGVFAERAINKGERITVNDVFFAMPAVSEDQTTSGELGKYRARCRASRDYKQGEPICEVIEESGIHAVRDIVHEAKGMLSEAGVVAGDDVEIELSHHYGVDRFREAGAVIVSVVNRDYCKKLLLVFPGQQHPSHAHTCKEETFQLLWGDLDVQLKDASYHLKQGDKMLVEAGVQHSFSSVGGAIFEEVSTTHSRTDSTYLDSRINSMDPLERKTLVRNW